MYNSCSIILTTFNWPEALDLSLKSLTTQSVKPNQVIIVDDGSQPSTRKIIEQYKRKLTIDYCWQPDRNFRAARARNLGLSRVTTPYVIMVDGDCLMPSNFIQSHLHLASRDRLVAGARLLLDPGQTRKIISDQKAESPSTLFDHFKFAKIPLGILRDASPNGWKVARTCNLGVSFDNLIKIRGFDEKYGTWGLEDSDLVIRLNNANVRIRNGRFAVCVAHLYHGEPRRVSISDQKYFVEDGRNDALTPTKSIFDVL